VCVCLCVCVSKAEGAKRQSRERAERGKDKLTILDLQHHVWEKLAVVRRECLERVTCSVSSAPVLERTPHKSTWCIVRKEVNNAQRVSEEKSNVDQSYWEYRVAPIPGLAILDIGGKRGISHARTWGGGGAFQVNCITTS
jgi:hypothetical protein